MRRRGASHAAKRARVDAEATQTFQVARKKLSELLKGFAFVEVHEVNRVAAAATKPEFFHGSAVTISNSRYSSERQERVFFDKGGRLRYNSNLEIGPCRLIDAAWGRDHTSATPQIGDVLIGVLEDNLRMPARGGAGRMTKVLRGWSRHGKILLELSRINEFGTTHGEFEIRDLLRQRECDMAEQFSNAFLIGNQTLGRQQKVQSSADDFWILARIILWGNTRALAVLHSIQSGKKCKEAPTESEISACSEIKISCSAFEFLSQLAFKLGDVSMLQQFNDYFVVEVAPEVRSQFCYNVPVMQFDGNKTPDYSHFIRPSSPGPRSPAYCPESPSYAPQSPQSLAPAHKAPQSPSYCPQSPIYSPSSPIADPPPPPSSDILASLISYDNI